MAGAPERQRSRRDYTIACICPMGIESAPVEGMLDEIHDPLPLIRDHNAYTLGRIGSHDVVVAVMPEIGNNAAAKVATQLLNDFPAIRFGLLVGIGGGIPGETDVRLGDVVVSQPTDTSGGVIQYDLGKRLNGQFQRTGQLNKPPAVVSANVRKLDSQHRRVGNQLAMHIARMMEKYPKMQMEYSFPVVESDRLFSSSYLHQGGSTCDECDQKQVITRPPRSNNEPRIHYGLIGSANVVMKDATLRDKLQKEMKILCLEMEAAGLMDDFPCLVIRGICDYADSHKNKKWQPYAAAVAAAYMKDLLLSIPLQELAPIGRTTDNPVINRYFLVPRRRVNTFFGRDEELGKIACFFHERTDRPRNLVLQAMGGQGKTQIALEYCQRSRQLYHGVFWISANSASAMIQSLISVAQEISGSAASGLSDDTAKAELAIRTLEGWQNRWLMVFDNCDDITMFSAIEQFVPQVGNGDILLTSRSRDLGEIGDLIEVPAMPRRVGVSLLLHRYRGISIDEYISEGTLIVNRLGGLALAIEQASAYMQYVHLPIQRLSEFLPRYFAQREKILQHTTSNFWEYLKLSGSNDREIAVNAFTTWEMSFQQLLDIYERADHVAHFLTLSAFLGPTLISENLFETHSVSSKSQASWMTAFTESPEKFSKIDITDFSLENTAVQNKSMNEISQALEKAGLDNVKESWDPAKFWGLLYQAFQMSLLQSISPATESKRASFILHPLIRDWLQLRLSVRERQMYTREAIEVLTSSVKMYDDWHVRAEIRLTILLHMDAMLVSDKEFFSEGQRLGEEISTCDNADHFALFYKEQGRYDDGLCLRRAEVRTLEKVYGEENHRTLDSMIQLVLLLEKLERYNEAEEIQRLALERIIKARGEGDSDALASMNNLALILQEQGKAEEAEKMHRQTLEAMQRTLGEDHQNTLKSTNNLAIVLHGQGKFAEAGEMFRQSMEGRKRLFGEEHPDTLMSMNNVAMILWQQNQLEKAEAIYHQTLELAEKVLGKEHPDTIMFFANLALCVRDQGRLVEAKQMFASAVKRNERALGKEHPRTLRTISILATMSSEQGAPNAAEKG